MKKFRRARTEEAKEIRLASIHKASVQLIDEHGFTSLTMDAVAKSCGLAKATLYVYYATREELLLSILKEDFTVWLAAFKNYVQKAEEPFSDSFAKIWIDGVNKQPRLAAGLTYLHAYLEPNMSLDFAYAWKSFIRDRIKEIHYVIMARFEPKLSLDLLGHFLAAMTGATIGLWIQSQSNDLMKKLFSRDPELAFLKTDFERHMAITIYALLEAPHYRPLKKLRIPRSSPKAPPA